MELSELLQICDPRKSIKLNNIRLQQRDREQNIPDDTGSVTTYQLMGGRQILHRVNRRNKQMNLQVVS